MDLSRKRLPVQQLPLGPTRTISRRLRYRFTLGKFETKLQHADLTLGCPPMVAVELLLQFLDDEHGQRCCQNLGRFEGSGWAEGYRRRKYCGSVAGHRVAVDCGQGISAPKNSVGHLRSSLCRRSASRVLCAG